MELGRLHRSDNLTIGIGRPSWGKLTSNEGFSRSPPTEKCQDFTRHAETYFLPTLINPLPLLYFVLYESGFSVIRDTGGVGVCGEVLLEV